MIVILFIALVVGSAAVVALAICAAAARGDRAMEDFFKGNTEHPTSNIQHPTKDAA